jgi:hypothetical protein
MKAPYITAVSWIVILFFLQAAAYCGTRQSNSDKEREKQHEEQRKEAQRLQVQKLQDEAREKREKQLEEIRQKYREDHLQRHPTEFYNARIMGNYGMKNGKPAPFVTIAGEIYDIPGEKRILVSIPARQTDAATGRAPALVLVLLEKSQVLSKGQKFSIPNVIDDGTYDYSKPDGTQVVIRMYRETPGITLKEFLQLRKDGYKFPGETDG